MTIRHIGLVRIGLILGLVWMLISADLGYAQRSGLSSAGSSTSGRLNARAGSSRLGNSSLRSGGLPARNGPTSRGGLGQSAGPADPSAQPQGREFRERAFVGRDAEDVRNTFRNLSRGQRHQAMTDMTIEDMNAMRESRKRWRDRQQQPPTVRVQLRPAFDYAFVSAAQVTLAVQTRLVAVMQKRGVAVPSIKLNGRTVTLRGQVRNEHEKALAGQLVAIEPGVSRVENLLTVAEK